MSSAEVARSRTEPWRLTVAAVAWVAIAIAFVALALLVWQWLGMALGVALGAEVTPAEKVPLYWWFVGLAIALTAVAIAAGIARRWVALVLALLLLAVSAFFALGLFSAVRSEIAPIEHVDEGPLPCQCYSGGDCDCPGG